MNNQTVEVIADKPSDPFSPQSYPILWEFVVDGELDQNKLAESNDLGLAMYVLPHPDETPKTERCMHCQEEKTEIYYILVEGTMYWICGSCHLVMEEAGKAAGMDGNIVLKLMLTIHDQHSVKPKGLIPMPGVAIADADERTKQKARPVFTGMNRHERRKAAKLARKKRA